MTEVTASKLSFEEDPDPSPLIRSLALAEGFHFYLLICNSPTAAESVLSPLRLWVAGERQRPVDLVRLDPSPRDISEKRPLTREDLVEDVLGRLFEIPSSVWKGDLIYAIDASRARPQDDDAWSFVFQRLNEQRNRLARHLSRPLVLVLPPRLEQLFAHAAPDFWSVRSLVTRIAGPTPAPPPAHSVEPREETWEEVSSESLYAGVEEARAWVDEVSRRSSTGPDLALAREALAVWRIRQARFELASGRLDAATPAAQDALALRRELRAQEGDDESRKQDLAEALETLADVDYGNGEEHRALAGLSEALLLRDESVRGERLLGRLAERLGAEVEGAGGGDELRRLRLGPGFPLSIDHCLVHLPPSGRPAAEVSAGLRARPEARDQVTLVLAGDLAMQDALHREIASELAALHVVPSRADLTELLLSPEPAGVLARVIASQVRRIHVSPYQTGGGVDKEATFFGRDELLSHVVSREPASYLVVGGRQLGKTSFLRAVERRLREDPRVDVRYLVLTVGDFAGELARSLGLRREAGLNGVAERLAQSEKRMLFLVDEADVAAREGRSLGEIRGLSEQGLCHFVLAGFWELYEAAFFDERPLRDFGETVCIGGLEEDACIALATGPMEVLGLGYEAGAVGHLVERTGRRADLIAIACNEVLKNLEPHARSITLEDVDKALESWPIQSALEGWLVLTRDEDDRRLDRALIDATVGSDSFTLSEAREALARQGLNIDEDRLERSAKRLELAWIVGTDASSYTYSVPLFVDRLRSRPGPA